MLVKHTLSAFPIFLFSVFRAPDYFISKVKSIIIRFLWGKGDGGGIPWMKWASLCKPLSQGGLGTCDLGCFNQALLAKVAWRLYEDADSLLAKELLGKYCTKEGLLSVKVGSGFSWGWRSILRGRDLLVKGLKWEVGSGQEIKVFQDEWVSGIDNPFVGQEVMSSLCDMKVGSLIDWRSREWHVLLVEAFFPSDVEKRILATYIPEGCRRDRKYWTCSRNGNFSVKSAYFFAAYSKYPAGVGKCLWTYGKSFGL